MSYQVGQAVIYNTPYEICQVGFVLRTYNDGRGIPVIVNDIDGDVVNDECSDNVTWVIRPATEAEILAEAVKHGWKENEIFFSPTGVISIVIEKGFWTYQFEYLEDIKDLSLFGQECITAHRLITALNLAKK